MKRFERLLNGDQTRSHGDIQETLGARSVKLCSRLRQYLKAAYDIEPELLFYGKKYGWCFRYRRGGKTLCAIFPEKGSFTVLVTLGRRELEKLGPNSSSLTDTTRDLIQNAHPYHDGKWLWIRVGNLPMVEDIKNLLRLKRKPRLP